MMKVKVSEPGDCVTLGPVSAKIISPAWQLGLMSQCCVTPGCAGCDGPLFVTLTLQTTS